MFVGGRLRQTSAIKKTMAYGGWMSSARGDRAGDTALIVAVPEAELVVGGWRTAFDSAAAGGIPAHITVLYPFLKRDQIDAGALAELPALLAEHRPFDLRFSRFRPFPPLLYLPPPP